MYHAGIDSLKHEHISKILLVPILDNASPKNILGIIWVGINKGFKQFIQQDIDRLVQFSNAVKGKLCSVSKTSPQLSHHDTLILCQDAQKALKKKMERSEKYFANTVHDIRTPMNAVIGFMELMLLNETDEQKKGYIDATLKSGEHIVSLINDALDMSKVSSGKMTLAKTSFSPMEGIGDIAKLFYNSMTQKSITFSIYIDPLMPQIIHSDLHRIKQILNNLLSNAMKFTPEEGKVSLEAKYNKMQDTLEISVLDTGIGVAKERQESIFNPYVQETNATSSQYGGTGLGLAISKQLSILLNGTLKLESEQGKGSQFIFTFPCDSPVLSTAILSGDIFEDISVLLYYSHTSYSPLHSIQGYLKSLNIRHNTINTTNTLDLSMKPTLLMIERDDAVKHLDSIQKFMNEEGKVLFIQNNFGSEKCFFAGQYKVLHRPLLPKHFFDAVHKLLYPHKHQNFTGDIHPNSMRFKGHSILVVDDSRINLKLLTEILKNFYITVSTALNGKEAVEIFKNKRFSVIFIDQNMPMMNGDEAIIKMREIEKEKHYTASVIYALTGDEDSHIKTKIMDSGADGILSKPIHIKEIYNAIGQAI